MKKLFLTSVILATFTLFATACGDDSSSGPEEESSSSIEAEGDSSSSHSGEGAPESSEESGDAKSSAEEKDAKSSSSEAKKDDSSSSEAPKSSATSSSSETPIHLDSVDPFCVFTDVTETSYAINAGAGTLRQSMVIDFGQSDESDFVSTVVIQGQSCAEVQTHVDEMFPEGGALPAGNNRTKTPCAMVNGVAEMKIIITMDRSATEYMPKASDIPKLVNGLDNSCEQWMTLFEITTDYLNPEMLSQGKYGKFFDTRNKKLYRTIKIGNQTWMAQNLNYVTHDGNADDGVSSWCYDDPESCAKYGRLYTWAAAMDKPESSCGDGHICGMTGTVQGICPDGWHLPSKEELHELFSFAATGVDSITTDTGTYAYYATSTMLRNPTEWTLGGKAESGVEIPEGLDEYGFSALPAGYYDAGYVDVGSWVYFWSSSEIGERNVYMAAIGTSYDDETSLFVDGKGYGQSVRCIKD